MAKIFYSTNSFLAYWVNRNYYGDLHHVWCSPAAGGRRLYGYAAAGVNPPSSSPLAVYKEFKRETESDDRHGSLISQNGLGISKGAQIKYAAGAINERQRDEILTIVNQAKTAQFKPLLYVIPSNDEVEKMLEDVPIGERANPLSQEYIIRALPGRLFDAWDLEDE